MKNSETYLEIVKAGVYSTIQDLGRNGYGHWGVPASGAMDHQSFGLANHILQNDENDACLEMTLFGGEFIFHGSTEIVICGALAPVILNNREMSSNKVMVVKPGDHLQIGSFRKGCRMYLGIKGGFQSSPSLSSRSWYPGITEKARLSNGDQLFFNRFEGTSSNSFAKVATDDSLMESGTIEVYAGPEAERLPKETFEELFESEFHLSAQLNRMGIQLEENVTNKLEEILTVPVYPGTVQLTPGGKLLILMRDAQVTGGYPRILQLSPNSINKMAQKKQGDKIRFQLVSDWPEKA